MVQPCHWITMPNSANLPPCSDAVMLSLNCTTLPFVINSYSPSCHFTVQHLHITIIVYHITLDTEWYKPATVYFYSPQSTNIYINTGLSMFMYAVHVSSLSRPSRTTEQTGFNKAFGEMIGLCNLPSAESQLFSFVRQSYAVWTKWQMTRDRRDKYDC